MIRVGIGGWDFEDWRTSFYPPGLSKNDALRYASRVLTTIEVNGTFYRALTPDIYKRWAEETPENFVFAVKGHRAVCAAAKLAGVGERIAWFMESGVLELGDKLGPLLWQLPPNKKFDREDIAAFLKLLPPEAKGRRLRHALEVRHETFVDPAFVEIAAQARVPIVYADSDDYPAIADVTGDFVYARLQRSSEDEAAGYPAAGLDDWALRGKAWSEGRAPDTLRYLGGATPASLPRDVFLFFISGAKARNPAAAMALIGRLGEGSQAAGGADALVRAKTPRAKGGAKAAKPAKKSGSAAAKAAKGKSASASSGRARSTATAERPPGKASKKSAAAGKSAGARTSAKPASVRSATAKPAKRDATAPAKRKAKSTASGEQRPKGKEKPTPRRPGKPVKR